LISQPDTHEQEAEIATASQPPTDSADPTEQIEPSGSDLRDARGRFAVGNTASLIHGGRSRQASALQAPLREELRRGVIADLGGDERALPRTLLQLVDRFCETSLLADAYFTWLQDQGGPIGTRGRQRAAVSGYLAALDRQTKLAQLIGLERRARNVASLSAEEFLATQQPKD
jgi:hypothetical protein